MSTDPDRAAMGSPPEPAAAQPAPPAEGEVGVLIRELQDAAFDLSGSDPQRAMLTRAAALLQQQQRQPDAALAQPAPPADGDVSGYADFAAWLAGEMPAGTIIGNPHWWAPRIARRAAALLQQQRPRVELPELPYADAPELFPYGSEGYVGWVAGRASGWHLARREVERQQAVLSLPTDGKQPGRESWDMSTADGSRCFASAILSRLVGMDKASAEDEQWLAAYLQVNCLHPLERRPRVELPEDPPEQFACWLRVDEPGDDGALFARALVTSVWSTARQEVERQQGEAPAEGIGTWPKDGPHRPFVAGAKWWEHTDKGATMWPADEAVKRYGRPAAPPADGEVAGLVAALKVIDTMQQEWPLLGNDDGTTTLSLAMSISPQRFTVLRDALGKAHNLLQQQQQPHPVAWCRSDEFRQAMRNGGSFNGWRDPGAGGNACDMRLYTLPTSVEVEG